MKYKLLSEITDEYISKMKKLYTVDPGTLSSMDWLMAIGAFVLTITTTAAFIYWIFKFFIFLMSCRAGTANFRDTKFWRRMAVSFFIIVLVMSGSMFVLMENFYTILENWGWTTS